MPFYHFTCNHGQEALSADPVVLPPRSHAPDRPWDSLPPEFRYIADVAWFTDLPSAANPSALGLTSRTIACDRTVYRWEVLDSTDLVPWSEYRQGVSAAVVAILEDDPAAEPDHWWVATTPIRVRFAPMVREEEHVEPYTGDEPWWEVGNQ